MEIMEIIKDAFVFPSKSLSGLAIFVVFYIAILIFGIFGVVFLMAGLAGELLWLIFGILFCIFTLILSFFVSGYHVDVVKTGIDYTSDVPAWVFEENFKTGIKSTIVDLIYLIIPAVIILIIGTITGLWGVMIEMFQVAPFQLWFYGDASYVYSNYLDLMAGPFVITFLCGLVALLVFVFIESMGKARLAKTGDVNYAIQVREAFSDIGRIGWGKVIATVILIAVVIFAINFLVSMISAIIPILALLSFITGPYFMLFAARAIGLLYRDIA